MENYFDKQLLYLVVGIIYLIIKNKKSSNGDKKTEVNKPYEHPPAPTTTTNWANTWEDKAPRAPAERTPLSRTITKKTLPHPTHRTTPQPAAQQPPSKKIDRVLHRYGSWKKAVIMVELFHPRT
jgi:hypothetical protein